MYNLTYAEMSTFKATIGILWDDWVGSQPIDGAEKHITALFYIVNQCSILLLIAVAWLTSDPVISYMLAMVALESDIFAFE